MMTPAGGPVNAMLRRRPEPPAIEIVGGMPETDEDDLAEYDSPGEIRPLYVPPYMPPPAWEEIATEDGVFLLRHDGKLYATRELSVAEVVGRGGNA